MASIDKRPNGMWRARWREANGAQRAQHFQRKLDAQNHLAGVRHSTLTGSYVDPAAGKVRLDEWWGRWQASRADLRESTRCRNEIYWRLHIGPTLGAVPLANIDRPLLRAWAADLVAGGMAPRSVRKAAQLVRQALEVAVEDRLLVVNPADGLRGLPKVATSEARFCSAEEVASLVDAADERYQPMILTAAWSGLRLGELCGLRRRSLDLMRRRIEVVDTIIEVRGKLVHQAYGKTGAAHRSVPIPAHVVDVLVAHTAGVEPNELVFRAPDGGPVRRSLFHARVWQPATLAAGLGARVPAPVPAKPRRTLYEGLRPHDLRHTAVSFWISAGADLTQLKRWAGHESVATLIDTYGHLMPDREGPVLAALEALAASVQSGRSGEVSEILRTG